MEYNEQALLKVVLREARRAFTSPWAFHSSAKPMVALTRSRARMMEKSSQSSTAPARMAATSIMKGIGPVNCLITISITDTVFSGISFGPNLAEGGAERQGTSRDGQRGLRTMRNSVGRMRACWLGSHCPRVKTMMSRGHDFWSWSKTVRLPGLCRNPAAMVARDR